MLSESKYLPGGPEKGVPGHSVQSLHSLSNEGIFIGEELWTQNPKGKHLYSYLREHSHMHTIYTRINMSQKCEDNCGLWVLNEISLKKYAESARGSRLGVAC